MNAKIGIGEDTPKELPEKTSIKIPTSIVFAWILGWPLASGFWSTLFAVIFPPWAWYLVAEKIISYLP